MMDAARVRVVARADNPAPSAVYHEMRWEISTQSCPQPSVDKSRISVRIIQTENALQTWGILK